MRTYSTAFREFSDWEVRHLPLQVPEVAENVTVRTQVVFPEAAPVEVLYRMYRQGERWMVYDVKIEGISLVTNYRSSFSMEIRKGGMDRLIQRIGDLNRSRIAQAGM
ncbi:MAG: ABC transporter substrate-binding protein [Candidatus Sedimenticola endophacoides]